MLRLPYPYRIITLEMFHIDFVMAVIVLVMMMMMMITELSPVSPIGGNECHYLS